MLTSDKTYSEWQSLLLFISKPLKQNNMKNNYGFKTTRINGTEIHTIRVAFKNNNENENMINFHLSLNSNFIITKNLNAKQDRIILSFTTLNFHEFNNVKNIIGELCKKIAQSNLNQKYTWVNSRVML
jgi:hypothetical protein